MPNKDIKYFLKEVNFDFEEGESGLGPHLAYCLPEQGGAASGLNDAFLFKADDIKVTDEITKAFEDLGLLDSLSGANSDNVANGVNKNTEQKVPDSKGDEMDETKLQAMIDKALEPVTAKYEAELEALKEVNKSLVANQEASDKAEMLDLVKSFGTAEDEVDAKVEAWTGIKKNAPEAFDAMIAELSKAKEKLESSDLFKEVGHQEDVVSDEEAALIKAQKDAYLAACKEAGAIVEDK